MLLMLIIYVCADKKKKKNLYPLRSHGYEIKKSSDPICMAAILEVKKKVDHLRFGSVRVSLFSFR